MTSPGLKQESMSIDGASDHLQRANRASSQMALDKESSWRLFVDRAPGRCDVSICSEIRVVLLQGRAMQRAAPWSGRAM